MTFEEADTLGWMRFGKIEGGQIMHGGHAWPVERHKDVVRRVQDEAVQFSRMRTEQHVAQRGIDLKGARLERQVIAQTGEYAV